MLDLFEPEGAKMLARRGVLRAPGTRGRPRLDLRPATSQKTLRTLLGMTVSLDPVSGAIMEIEIREARGDLLSLSLSDHRQKPSQEALERALTPLPRP